MLEVVNAFAQASGQKIAFEIAPRRPGDIAECFADPSLAARELNWRAELDLKRMVTDA